MLARSCIFCSLSTSILTVSVAGFTVNPPESRTLTNQDIYTLASQSLCQMDQTGLREAAALYEPGDHSCRGVEKMGMHPTLSSH